jgi:preprotein translocase subunit YajC
MFASLLLFAQEEVKKQAAPEGIGGLFSNPIVPILVVMVLFFFLIILPAQRRQKKELEARMAGLKKNDEVVTTAGIIGIIANIKEGEDEVTLKIDDNTRMRLLKSAIAQVRKKSDEPPATSAPAPAATPNTNIKPTA